MNILVNTPYEHMLDESENDSIILTGNTILIQCSEKYL